MPVERLIENPILNSPFETPSRHFKFDNEGITNQIEKYRRSSSYFVPIARARGNATQEDWVGDRIAENKHVNDIRKRVDLWRKGGYQGITSVTRKLLDYWNNPEREKKLFFCQIEALETMIYINECANRFGDSWILENIRNANNDANPGLLRIACKMATGAGKTVVMGMIIAWQALNKMQYQKDRRFSDTFLVVTPGITIRDRLRVLLPHDPDNYYRQRDILPNELLQELQKIKIVITNFHAFKQRERINAGSLTKALLSEGNSSPFTETPDQMVRRVCRELGSKRNIIIINDEAHHCYCRKPDGEDIKLKGDERKEAEKREEEARIWLNGIQAVKEKTGVNTIYDLSATPFFLRGSGYPEGTLFPWVVSDFSLIDAIESGIVKIPRVPVSDNAMTGEQPTYRDLWLRIREKLPKTGRKTNKLSDEPDLPKELEGALQSLYANYVKTYKLWENNNEAIEKGLTPPVFIVVCNNTNVSRMAFNYIAGWEKEINGSTMVQAGKLDIFRNDDGNGNWLERPNTILVDSEQLESGEAMSAEFKKIAASEIEEFKMEYSKRFPGRSAEKLTDEDLLREVMNTVGKKGKLGEQVKCVVSVSMLTEGWDANTVTHILGVRAFGTQLLCEQVVGRGLRRTSYAVEDRTIDVCGQVVEFTGFPPEYAEVYGVPFSFIPCSGAKKEPKPGPIPTRVRALEERIACEIAFPRLAGYRYDIPGEKISAKFTKDCQLALSTADLPTKTENAPIVGESSIHTLDDLKKHRMQEVAFLLSKLLLEKYFRWDGEKRTEHTKEHHFDKDVKVWLFPQILEITRRWLKECVICKDNAFPQLLLLIEFAHDAVDRIYRSIVSSSEGTPAIKPILRSYDTVGSTRYVDFDTTRPVYATQPDKCHISHVVADTESWEQKMAQTLEDMEEVVRYVKNHNLGFAIPYTINNEEKSYYPDFIACIDDGKGKDDLLNLVLEVSGEARKDKKAKVDTARTLWIPAVNNHGGFGRWEFIEISDPWDAANSIRKTCIKK
ncbi:DEAD/DEAH box helicase family protein [Candidatus Sumerlaeota bacterium]|nr:DEAD/DEAH box helicase family protein [Candidatus Sumerlaeota bacterium]